MFKTPHVYAVNVRHILCTTSSATNFLKGSSPMNPNETNSSAKFNCGNQGRSRDALKFEYTLKPERNLTTTVQHTRTTNEQAQQPGSAIPQKYLKPNWPRQYYPLSLT